MDSHVSKKAVIDVIENFNVFESREDQIALERKIAELPSAESKSFEWCTDCKEYDQESHCCHRWSKMIRKTVEEMQAAIPHWIPVTEDTLPEEGRIVVVYGEKGTWDYGKYRGYGPDIHYWYWKNKTFKKAYWWMYKEDALPEPARG